MRRTAWLCLLPLVAWRAPLAHASTEDFSTFSAEAQEEDDESLLDHSQARFPLAWEREWSAGGQAFRTSQGCLTAGEWLTETQLRLSAPVGRSMRFGFDLRQRLSDDVSVELYDLTWWYESARSGRAGLLFRPFHDKSRQDFGVLWAAGSDSAGLRAAATFIVEDTFNNLWAFRQTRVGERSEPYRRRPYEPALRVGWRGTALRVAVDGTWLTPSRKLIRDDADPDTATAFELWGAQGAANLALEGERTGFALTAWNKQARSAEGAESGPADDANYRRQWQVDAALSRRVGSRVTARAHAMYGERAQRYGPDPRPRSFTAVDRLTGLEADVRLGRHWTATTGALIARITVAQRGWLGGRTASPGTRTESRAFFGLHARFGNMWLAATEGLELDSEPYEVWLIHDKAFFQVMARF